MAMKYIQLWSMAHGSKRFKWEWALEWEENKNENLRNAPGYENWWVPRQFTFKNRRDMRTWKAYLSGARWVRNIQVKRRLVQSNWEDYTDSFTWNKGCGC